MEPPLAFGDENKADSVNANSLFAGQECVLPQNSGDKVVARVCECFLDCVCRIFVGIWSKQRFKLLLDLL